MSNYPMFSVLGIEIEYMLVDKDSLNIQPKSDIILSKLAGELVNEVELGDIAVSNELVLHVIELKNQVPQSPNAPIANQFQNTLWELQPLLEEHKLALLPTGAHPWMNPLIETLRWPHGNQEIYKQYDKIFNCQGHGWANLQSMHVNLPYSNPEEFRQLHNLIRLLVPMIPALAASSPVLDAKTTGLLDSRLYFYSRNQEKIPSISGDVIPEFIESEEHYQDSILSPMYMDISPFDPEKILQFQWLNSRAAIPKFDDKAIEIRIIDSQECTTADIAIAKAIHYILKQWQESSDYYLCNPCSTMSLKHVFDKSIEKGFDVLIDDKELLKQWQMPSKSLTLKEIWFILIDKISSSLETKEQQALELIINKGNLSQRILNSLAYPPDMNSLRSIYKEIAQCLIKGEQYIDS